jgi:CarD family transcriptional regulator
MNLYKVGDIIIYSCEGACRVESIEKLDVAGIDADKLYYNLSPVYHVGNIFVPIDTKMFMRPVIKCEEVQSLISLIPMIKSGAMISQSRRMLEDNYNKYIQTHDCLDLIKLLKAIEQKAVEVAKDKKKLGAIDERFKKKAEELLFGEFAVVLDIPKEDVRSYIANKVQETANLSVKAV